MPAGAGDRAIVWAADTRSPAPAADAPLEPLERAALARCGSLETRLGDTARAVVARKVRGLPIPETGEPEFLQRSSGQPHPLASRLDRHRVLFAPSPGWSKLDAWLATRRPAGERRCGVASGIGADGRRVVSVVAVDALPRSRAASHERARRSVARGRGEAPRPCRRRQGRRSRTEPARRALSPRPSTASRCRASLRARGAPESSPCKALADVDGGPRPVLEGQRIRRYGAARQPW